ncbi:unnamed protein product [Leptidea sinapis]|uniref:Decaprenyl-diphosphate synthase subunit 2 n=1 Tax=Leptidea sinapis TaxID=189913 RepID=A0A5E4QD41_9NEOP|nr:unnamed protein product [Leptidea sinapis]
MHASRAFRRISGLLHQKRPETTVASLTKDEIVMLLRPPFTNWTNAIREAEKVVGSNHLVLQTAKNVLYGDSKNLQPWGLIILLLAKAVKTRSTQSKVVEEQQRQLAELTEMMRTGHLIHKGIVNVPFATRSKNSESAIFGNKIAILLGDYLLVTANAMLAGLRNAEVLYIVSTALKDLSESEFLGERDEQNKPLPGKPKNDAADRNITFTTTSISIDDVLGNPRKEWTARSLFNGVSLLGRSCQSVMLLGQQNREIQNSAYHFGCNTKHLYDDHAKKAIGYVENISQGETIDVIKKLINTF